MTMETDPGEDTRMEEHPGMAPREEDQVVTTKDGSLPPVSKMYRKWYDKTLLWGTVQQSPVTTH